MFSDKSTPSKVLSDDDSWSKKNQISTIVPAKVTPGKSQKPAGNNVAKVWQNNASESQNDTNMRKAKDKPVGNSSKFKDMAKAFEQKDQEAKAEPVVRRRSEFGKMDSVSNSPFRKSLDLTDSSSPRLSTTMDKKPTSPLAHNAPNALLPREQRYPSSGRTNESPAPLESDQVGLCYLLS